MKRFATKRKTSHSKNGKRAEGVGRLSMSERASIEGAACNTVASPTVARLIVARPGVPAVPGLKSLESLESLA